VLLLIEAALAVEESTAPTMLAAMKRMARPAPSARAPLIIKASAS
jgi:hypothetical protein